MSHRALYPLLNTEMTTDVTLRGESYTLHLLTAAQMIDIDVALSSGDRSDFQRAAESNAALAAKSLHKGDAPLFSDPSQVLATLSIEEINAIVHTYRQWTARINPSIDCAPEEADTLKKV